MASRIRSVVIAGVVALGVAGMLAAGCSSDSGGGGGGSSGKDGGTGATGGTGGATGGTGGATGGASGGGGVSGSGGSAGCPSAPTDCDTCQNTEYADCYCDAAETACLDDADCSSIWDCAVDGADGGIGPCLDLDATGAACEQACIGLYPAGGAKYLAMVKCIYCDYCATACSTSEYCTALDNPSDAGSDAAGDAASDAASDATGD